MGIPGMGPPDYLALLVEVGLALNPDMAIVSFFVGNDLERQKRKGLYRYSYFAALIKYVIDLNKDMEGQIFHKSLAYEDSSPTMTDEAYMKHEIYISRLFNRHYDMFDKRFTDSMGHLIRIRDTCIKHNIRLLIVIIPDVLQVANVLQQRVISASGHASHDFDFVRPNKMLRARLKELNIPYIDLLNDFASAAEADLYKPNDTHWNIAGNKLASEIMLDHLRPQLR